MHERKVQRVTVRVEFADDSVQEFTAEEPASAMLTVKGPFPEGYHGYVDLSRIPVSGGHTLTLQLTLGGSPPLVAPPTLATGPCGYAATGYGRDASFAGDERP